MSLASSTTVAEAIDNLIAGGDVRTDNATLSSGQNVSRGTVLGRVTASGEIIVCDLAAADGSEQAIGIAVHDVDATAAAKSCPFYMSGSFRDSEMVWHASFTSAAKKNIAFDGSAITIV